MGAELRLVVPSAAYIASYREALELGWSPSTVVNNSAQTLEMLDRDADKLMGQYTLYPVRKEGAVALDYRQWWIWDDVFCGVVSLVTLPNGGILPEHVLGHVGYNVVPWKQRQTYATRAVLQLVEKAVALGLDSLRIACRPENVASCKVAERVGALLIEERVFPAFHDEPRRLYELSI